jgi:serralysin
VRVFDGLRAVPVAAFYAYDPSFRGGVNVAAGDVDGDGRADVVTGPGSDGGPVVEVFGGATSQSLGGFLMPDPGFRGGVRVATVDVDGDTRAEVVTATGPGGGPRVSVLDGPNGSTVDTFFAFNPAFFGGTTVAAAPR